MVNSKACFALLAVSFLVYLYLGRRRLRRPPGPTRWPIIGNLFEMPTTLQWEKFSDWARIYGDITYLEVCGKPIAVINSPQLASELLDKRSLIYSSRPQLVMAGELCNLRSLFPIAPYGTEWREQRKLVSSALSKSKVQEYHTLQEAESRKLVYSMLKTRGDLKSEIKLRLGTTITRLNYGYYPTSASDPLLALPMHAVDSANDIVGSGVWMVDVLPFLRHLPIWVPGTGFLKIAERVVAEWESGWLPYRWCLENLPSGKSLLPNLCSTILSEGSPTDEVRLVKALTSILAAGVHTCQASLLWFFAYMILHPEVQEKAQEELDRVIGTDRLPLIQDRQDLPYIQSVITEVIRMRPALPLSLPHALIQDDVFDDQFHLPKDTLLFPNVWYMLHNPAKYPDPDTFNPDRYGFSQTEMTKVEESVFGFGRRSCPGIYLAQATLFSFASTVLATCTILPEKDGILPSTRPTHGAIAFPEEFNCRFEPRSQKALTLLNP